MNKRKNNRCFQLPAGGVLCRALVYLVLCSPITGCNSFGNGKLVQQLQHENERLLTEFRAEKARREEFERQNKTLEARLSESEKLLARQSGASSRLSSLPSAVGLPPLKPFDSANKGNSNQQDLGGGSDGNATIGVGPDGDGFRWQRRVN